MKKSTKDTLWSVAVLFLLFVACGVAGRSDYQDAVVAEMKNNGSYWKLSQQYPQATDAMLIKLYKNQKNNNGNR